MSEQKSIYGFTVRDAEMRDFPLANLKDRAALIVNVASRCGFTYQYQALEKLYCEFKNSGFVVLGFPCNQFGSQEPGTEKEILEFCHTTYQVSFPIMAKIDVNGPKTEPLYAYLKSSAPGIFGSEMIKWNFTKFLISREGQVIARYAPGREPEEIRIEIERALLHSAGEAELNASPLSF